MGKGLECTFLQRRYENNQQVQEKMLDVTHHQENANQDHYELPLTSTRMAIIRKDRK